ncbi:hypothetical protein HNS38_16865 [Lentimicrobium sp. L6]|uniref:sugar-binding protein n=1 Tax=Lentimicrobium sp. L6 TaxID=2735916 RepID=UPI0015570543|nr:sugar-binding protein [Lentimicrobium sp. L6]NPD86447.1 hypothetical protein [Lentimicrobium sp. L6]
MKKIVFLLIVFSILVSKVYSQDIQRPPHFISQKVNSSEMIIDGIIDESAWERVEWSGEFQDIQGPEFPKPNQPTKMKMLWSDSLLFIAAYLEENHIWAHIEEDEKVMYYDNDFEVFIDVNRDHHHYFEFEFNALNKKWDLYLDQPYRDSVTPDNAWNCKGLQHEIHILGSLNEPSGNVDSAWTIEIAIPIHQLTGNIEPGDVWNVNFSRVQWQTNIVDGKYVKKKQREDNWVWSPTWQINIHRPEYWGQCYFEDEENPEIAFMSEQEWGVRLSLMQAYDFQRAYWKRHQSYSDTWPGKEEGVEMLSQGYRTIYQKEVDEQVWRVNEKGRIWLEKDKKTPKFWIWMSGHKELSYAEWELIFEEINDMGIRGLLLSTSSESARMLVPLAKKYELQLHIWMWAMNRGDAPAELMSVNDLGKSLAEEQAYVGYYKFMCPALPETKKFIENKVNELRRIEGIDGIHLDYIRYVDVFLPSGLLPKYDLIQDDILPAFDYGYHPEMLRKFEMKYGKNPKSIPDYAHDSLWQQFRMDQVTGIVNGLAHQFSSKEIQLTAAVFPDPNMSRTMVRQDWGRWNLDAYFPMVYNGFYEAGTDWIQKRMEVSREYFPHQNIFCGLYLVDCKEEKQLTKSIAAAFKGGASGISFFDYWGMKEHHKKAIRKAIKKQGLWVE